MNFLAEHGINSYEELESRLAAMTEKRDAAHASIKDTEAQITELSLVMEHASTYRQLKPVYDQYRQSKDKEKFLRGHERKIILNAIEQQPVWENMTLTVSRPISSQSMSFVLFRERFAHCKSSNHIF